MADKKAKNAFEIKQIFLEEHRKTATNYLRSVNYTPTVLAKQQTDGVQEISALLMKIKNKTSSNAVSLIELVKVYRDKFIKHSVVPTSIVNDVILSIQEGLAIASYIQSEYEGVTNLSGYQQRVNATGKLTPEESQEFNSLKETSTAILLQVWSSYVLFTLKKKPHNPFSKFQGIPEIYMMDTPKGISSVIYYLHAYLTEESMIATEQDLLDCVIAYFAFAQNYVIQRSDNFKYTAKFTEAEYKLEGSDFSVSGWDKVDDQVTISVDFNKEKYENIVGNTEAKHLAKRTIGAMLAYDFEEKKNPFDEIAKYARLSMGYGWPGTGKSLIIAATATELYERCQWLGYKFIFHPFPDNIVSTYQGGSAERAIEWFKHLSNPGSIIYAPIDDAENNLMDRSKDGVSAGVKEVIGVFLRMMEGAYALSSGNFLVGLYTNRPEDLDKAVLSRIQRRAPIQGAKTHNDFLDQNYLWLKKYEKSLDKVQLIPPANYEYLNDQKEISKISNLQQTPDEIITHPRMQEIYHNITKKHAPTSSDFYAALAFAIQQACPLFTSREQRNVQTNVDTRLCDFDYPEDWWKDEKIFFHQPYATKVQLLKELMVQNMKGESFADIMLQETLKYMNNFISINLSEEDQKIQRLVDSMIIEQKAMELFKTKKQELQPA